MTPAKAGGHAGLSFPDIASLIRATVLSLTMTKCQCLFL